MINFECTKTNQLYLVAVFQSTFNRTQSRFKSCFRLHFSQVRFLCDKVDQLGLVHLGFPSQ
ncbi:Uncharacterised protein [Vibrio cholerae]|nr:Uncharacterised protein [Vibrio cholerae]CSA51141.1 Uncharacterised protein [Vibrio cholerae]CSA62134.1 Uncharacterised protein [Vibrio cholerae]CSA63256.1 Uncharacterised protein [Vibrio cholerae]CSA72505.1 Uncharacterised protein [Vibrio cholerae]